MSATRYSGDLTITLKYLDPSVHGRDYRATITWVENAKTKWAKKRRDVVYVGAPAHLRHGVDSPEAFDEIAHAAISFASGEEPDIGEHAAFRPDGSGWHIGRHKRDAWQDTRATWKQRTGR